MNIRQIYESLLEGNRITLSFSSHADYISVYSQLRNVKSLQDSAFKAVAGVTISEGKVIRSAKVDSELEKFIQSYQYTFWMGDRKVEHKIQFQILDITPPLIAPIQKQTGEGDVSS